MSQVKNQLCGLLVCLTSTAICPLVYADTSPSSTIQSTDTATNSESHFQFPTEASISPFVVGLQSTYIFQHKDAFNAAYTGSNSLLPTPERSYTFTATALLGARLWQGGEFYITPELYQAHGLSDLTGLAGPVNGEQQKGGSSHGLKHYIPRTFLKQTWDLGGDTVKLAPSLTQFADTVTSKRLVVTAGTMAITDIFDTSPTIGDPRNNFMNWSFLTYGAYDYAADTRGYTSGIAVEYYNDDWAVRYGRFLMPKQANGFILDDHIQNSFGEQLELEHDHKLDDLSGLVKVLIYRNVANFGNYRAAVDQAATDGVTPNIVPSQSKHTKDGVGIHIEQHVTPDISLFTRLSTNNGKYEQWAFTEIDQQAQFGLTGNGRLWGRNNDNYGVAYAINGLSNSHKDYLKAGGLGGFLGDGTLRYHTEDIFEAYYNIALNNSLQLTLDYQNIANPGYNANRHGPVNVFGMRVHAAFF